MNTYKVTVKSPEIFGNEWLKNVVEIANKGGKIEEGFFCRVSFPHEVTMTVTTDEKMGTDIVKGIIVHPVVVAKTREEMEAMEWEDFKKECKTWGITGRHRETMTNQYMKATKQSEGLLEVEEEPSKKPVKKPEKKGSAPKESTLKEDVLVDTNKEE